MHCSRRSAGSASVGTGVVVVHWFLISLIVIVVSVGAVMAVVVCGCIVVVSSVSAIVIVIRGTYMCRRRCCR